MNQRVQPSLKMQNLFLNDHNFVHVCSSKRIQILIGLFINLKKHSINFLTSGFFLLWIKFCEAKR